MSTQRSDPRRATNATRAKITGQANRRQDTARRRPDRDLFRSSFALTVTELETALAIADAVELARALDPYYFEHTDGEVTFRCPACDRKQASAISRWTWRCGACDQHAAWWSLRQHVALDVAACCRLAEIVHGVEVGRPARVAS